jgi:hypothetical protein
MFIIAAQARHGSWKTSAREFEAAHDGTFRQLQGQAG